MKKAWKWIGIGFLAFLCIIAAMAFLGKDRALQVELNNVDLSQIEDGSYEGTFDCYRFTNQVIVTVQNHQILDIAVVKTQNGRESINLELIERVLEAQSPALDAISGATADKNAFLKAVENALLKAQE
ncbi:MAG: FMN-binding protein [Clostridiaceae bacterium]